jgi:hypothetical protein
VEEVLELEGLDVVEVVFFFFFSSSSFFFFSFQHSNFL